MVKRIFALFLKWNNLEVVNCKEIMLKLQDIIIEIHNRIIKESGGEMGVRENGGIYNSLYKLLVYQAKNQNKPKNIGAFALNEFSKRHYFFDGNKRTAYLIAKIFLLINRHHLNIEYKEATNFIIKIAKYKSKITIKEIEKWLNKRSIKIKEEEIEKYLKEISFSLST